ncbi:MAG TPA: hypothetical protein PKJ88_03610, partial [Flexilinea sp.]|nr:hypothetical protein [Flexilinea sp.]
MSEQQRIQGGRVKLRDRIVGIIFVVLGLVIYLFFYKAIASGTVSTFIMTPGGITRGVVGNWIIPARP